MKQTPVSFHSFTYGRGKRAFCPVLQRNAAIDPVHSSACPPLSFSTGALYSRKVTLEGEEVSLQIQDTPCVALQVTNGGTEKAHRCCVSQLNTWMEKVNVGGRDMMTKRSSLLISQTRQKAPDIVSLQNPPSFISSGMHLK